MEAKALVEPTYRQVGVHLRLDGPDAFATANYRSLITDVLERLGRVDEACTMQRDVFNACSRYLGEDDSRTLKEELRLNRLLRLSGDV